MDGLTGGSGGTEAFPLNELPVGFGMALAMNEQAMQGYAALRIGGECYCQPPSRVRICPVR